jgi:hypothetical protein
MDPLRPFAALIRSLWTGTSERSQSAQRAGSRGASAGSAPVVPAQRIADRLQLRLRALQDWDASRAREMFVEDVLLSELGGELVRDPKFAEIVKRVSDHLGNEPAVSARLNDVLRDLIAAKQVP